MVLADVRERRDARDVADRPDVLGRAQPLVDLDAARRIRRPSASSPSTFGLRPVATSTRSKRRERPPASASRRPSADLDAVLLERRVDERRRLGVHAGQEPLGVLDERHLRPHAREELRQLAADRPAAEDEQRARHLRRLGRLAVRPVVEALDRRPGRRATSRWRSRAGRRAARAPSTRTSPGSATTPSPRTSAQRLRSSQSTCDESSRSATTSRQREDRRGVEPRPAVTPACARVAATSSVARSIVFVGMQAQYEHSPPTSRRSTSVSSASASSRRRAPTKCSPDDPPPRTTTFKATRGRSPAGTPWRPPPATACRRSRPCSSPRSRPASASPRPR